MTDLLDRLRLALADRYAIERELGAGGMATVYLAHDLKHDRGVGMKVLRPELAAVIGAERFLSEIRTTANLQHPHILPLHDSGEADSFLYYVMPFVEGESLRDRLKREKQLPIREAVRIATEIASALDYAHRHGVIHRDIKPENVLLHDGRALVADFGIALAASKAGTRMTETGMSLGTPQYMSPEQAMGERELDARSDVYALGCVTYEMLTGEPPFSGPTAQAIVAKVMTAEPAEMTSLRKTIPLHVANAVHTALQKLPADRFGSAREFAEALGDSYADGRARRTPEVTPARRDRPMSRRMTIALVAAAALAAGAMGTAALIGRRAPSPVAARVLIQFPAAQGLIPRPFPTMAVPSDGSGVLYAGAGVNTRMQLWLRRWDRLEAQRLMRTADENCCAAFSPSGDSIAYLAAPRKLNVLPLTGGPPTTLSDSGLISVSDWGGGLDWGADGMLYVSGTDGLLRVDPRSGARQLVAQRDSARGDLIFLWPDLLPGARGALVTVIPRQAAGDPERAAIGVADFGTRRVEIVLQGVRAIYAPTGHLIVAKSDGVLWAVPFDARKLRLAGTAVELADTVAVRSGAAAPGVVELALASTGTLTYVTGGEERFRIVWVDRSGAWRPVADRPSDVAVQGLALSPDGRRIAAGIGGADGALHLWVQPAAGGPGARLTFDGLANMRPRWRPRTNSVSFLANREPSGAARVRLYERDAEGRGGLRPLAIGDPRTVGGHAWSADGEWLVFRTDDQERGNGDIMAIRPGVDTIARALVATAAEELAPAVSPDGRWLAYSSNESGRREVYVRPFLESGERRYQISTAGGVAPVWSRNGRELFFIDASQNMVSVPVAPGTAFEAGRSRILFPAAGFYTGPFEPQFDTSPDGQRFVMVRREAGAGLGAVVVFNFLDDLKRRMAAR